MTDFLSFGGSARWEAMHFAFTCSELRRWRSECAPYGCSSPSGSSSRGGRLRARSCRTLSARIARSLAAAIITSCMSRRLLVSPPPPPPLPPAAPAVGSSPADAPRPLLPTSIPWLTDSICKVNDRFYAFEKCAGHNGITYMYVCYLLVKKNIVINKFSLLYIDCVRYKSIIHITIFFIINHRMMKGKIDRNFPVLTKHIYNTGGIYFIFSNYCNLRL